MHRRLEGHQERRQHPRPVRPRRQLPHGRHPGPPGSAALHHYLIDKAVRSDVGLILESGEPREVHHFCTLIGYGITAINPYIALESIKELIANKKLQKIDYETAKQNYIDAAVKGILAVMSKMGISTVTATTRTDF